MLLLNKQPPVFRFALRDDVDMSFLPKKAEDKATGWDVRCAEPKGVLFHPGEMVTIRLGFRMFAPDGWWLELRPRSGTFVKKSIHALYGVIDETYSNELLFAARYLPAPSDPRVWVTQTPLHNLFIDYGERIGQIIPVRREEMIVEEITNDDYDKFCEDRNASRGTGGFGSTGDK